MQAGALEAIMKGQMQLHRPMEHTPVGMVCVCERGRDCVREASSDGAHACGHCEGERERGREREGESV